MKNIHLNKWISVFALLFIIIAVFYIYLIARKNCGDGLVGVQLLSMVILISAVVAYLISWKMILTVTGLYAKIDDTIDDTVLQETVVEPKIERNTDDEVKNLIKKFNKSASIHSFAEQSLKICCHELNFVSALFFHKINEEFEAIESWAFYTENKTENIKPGIGLHGQVIKNKQALMLDKIPENYMQIISGTGRGVPKSLYMIPIINKDECIALLEFASFENANQINLEILTKFAAFLADEYNSLEG